MTMTLISTIEVGSGGAASVEFASLPQGYTDLFVAISAKSSLTGPGWDSLYIRFNGSETNYEARNLYEANTSVGSNLDSAVMAGFASCSSNTGWGISSVYIPNYTSNKVKMTSVDSATEHNGTGYITCITSGIWLGTDPINKIKIGVTTGPLFLQYSTISLYGIQKGGTTPTVA